MKLNQGIAIVIFFIICGCTNKLAIHIDNEVDSKSLLPYSILLIPQEYNRAGSKQLKKNYRIDTSFIFYSTIYYNDRVSGTSKMVDTIYIYIGKSGGDLFFSGDQNFNRRFDDDSLIIVKNFFSNDTISWLHQIQPKLKYNFKLPFSYEGVNRIVQLSYDVDIYKNIPAFKMGYIFGKMEIVGLNLNSSNGYKYGSFHVGLKNYKVVSDDLIRARMTGINKERIYIYSNKVFKKLKIVDRYAGVKLNDSVKIGSKYWLFSSQSFEGDTITLTKIHRRNKDWGNKVGQYSIGFLKKDVNGNMINSDSLFKKTTFLIFWGWWCLPCLERIPDLKILYDQLKGFPVNFAGIALDDPTNVQFTLDEIKEYKIPWVNIIADMYSKEKSELNNLFDIDGIPTYIIIDKSRKIVFKGYKLAEAINTLYSNMEKEK